ncbi:MAG: ABC transporter substrate-binding protein [Gordonibacter sp.]|nr:ABC transporter substrate-binding protein [Gordonibacter sp.]
MAGLDEFERGRETTFFGRRAFVKLMGTGLLLTLAPAALSGCSGVTDTLDAVLEGKRRIIDDAGREVEIPTSDRLERIYFTSSLAHIYCFTMAPDLLAGTSMQFTPYELEFLPDGTRDLPYLGSLSGGGEINREALMIEDVQLVFSISGAPLTPSAIDEAVDLQGQTNIPCVVLDGSFDCVGSCYRMLGDIFGLASRGEKLAAYCEDIYTRVTDAVAGIPDSEKVSLYYAEGPDGLQTEPDAAQHALAFLVAGAKNVAAVPENEGQGMSNVSLEQVLAWDPEVIVAWDLEVRGGADELIRRDKNWSTIRAVKNGRVYTMPNVPFAWCDRPPGVQRFLGIQWVANMLYPDAYDVDMVQVVKEFYSTMYWVDITDDQAKELLGNSYPPYAG